MLRARLKYGASHAKIMGLYGKRLTEEDWAKLFECRSVFEISSYLKGHKGWGRVMSSLPAAPAAAQLEGAIRSRVFEEYGSLCHFLLGEDRACLALFAHRAEHDFLVHYLSERHSFYKTYAPEITDFVHKNSRLDLAALEQSRSFAEVQEAVRGTIYEKPLSGLTGTGSHGWPDYMIASATVENAYFTAVFSYIAKKYKGLGENKLKQLVGLEADLLNLVSELRLQRSFRGSLEQARSLLVPISCRLKPALLSAIAKAGSEAEALEILRRSPFGKDLALLDVRNIEQLYYNLLGKFCKKLLRGAEPDISLVFAYLILKELECKKLIRLTEAVQKGYQPRGLV